MLALGIAALAGAVALPSVSVVDPDLTYRLPASAPATGADRTTPAMDTLFDAAADRRGRRDARRVAGVTLAVEGARSRRRHGPAGQIENLPSGLRSYGARQTKEMAMALSAEWDAGGHWRLSGGFDRVRLGEAALPRGRTGATTTVAALEFVSGDGMTIGGGWRARGGGRAGPERLVALAAGAQVEAKGPFMRAAWPVEGVDIQVEASSAQLGGDAVLLGSGTDRRLALSLHRGFR